MLKWLLQSSIDTALIDPGKPWQNGADESFNGKFRDECLSLEWFRNRTEAKIVIESWRRHYNEVRPHSSLSYQTPVEFKSKRSTTNPNGAILQQRMVRRNPAGHLEVSSDTQLPTGATRRFDA